MPQQQANSTSGPPNTRAVFLTAGAAGMYCGSCMHDNSLAKAIRARGVDLLLQPVYTPIRTDEPSVASDQVFFGGIRIYLLQLMPWLRWLPSSMLRWLDSPQLIRWATRKTQSTSATKLGQLTVSMLSGMDGRQRDEVARLVKWLSQDLQPDAVVLSNLLIGGSIPELKRKLPGTRIIVLLQGDDIFLDHLPQPYRDQAIHLCRQIAESVDLFVVNSQFYADKMAATLKAPASRLVIHPLSIDTTPFTAESKAGATSGADKESVSTTPLRIGYLARIAPEKGFHHLVDAFIQLASQSRHRETTLHVAGWLGDSNQDYFHDQLGKLDQAGLSDRFHHHGSPDLAGKADYLKSLDLLCVPTDYEDPKGLFVLEANSSGVPVVMPDHGAFGELVRSTGGGVLYPPGDESA
ncbi:MAG: glycosyltransferase family 4 protein, partial [Planctomycetota bacterium]